jgi:hypothetical protein
VAWVVPVVLYCAVLTESSIRRLSTSVNRRQSKGSFADDVQLPSAL